MSSREMQFVGDAGVLYSATAICNRVKSTLAGTSRLAQGDLAPKKGTAFLHLSACLAESSLLGTSCGALRACCPTPSYPQGRSPSQFVGAFGAKSPRSDIVPGTAEWQMRCRKSLAFWSLSPREPKSKMPCSSVDSSYHAVQCRNCQGRGPGLDVPLGAASTPVQAIDLFSAHLIGPSPKD